MSLRDKLQLAPVADERSAYRTYGVLNNPFPTSNQTAGNPHYPIDEDDAAESRIASFFQSNRSEVLVVLGTQGVGKTNFLNYLEGEIQAVKAEMNEYYVVRYLADPEPSFDATIRTILQELGPSHLRRLAEAIAKNPDALNVVKSYDLRQALHALSHDVANDELLRLAMDWLLGFRLLNSHRQGLGVNFRLDTVESRTAVLRDYIVLSRKVEVLKGIFLLLDELEKQAGVLGPTAVVRYLSAMRAIIDALPEGLFLVIAVTPDAMRRYSAALPAFRSRLENTIELSPLKTSEGAAHLANFYLAHAKDEAKKSVGNPPGSTDLVSLEEIANIFTEAYKSATRRGDDGVRHREFLNTLHNLAEERLQSLNRVE